MSPTTARIAERWLETRLTVTSGGIGLRDPEAPDEAVPA
jgi:hypothetical protein